MKRNHKFNYIQKFENSLLYKIKNNLIREEEKEKINVLSSIRFNKVKIISNNEKKNKKLKKKKRIQNYKNHLIEYNKILDFYKVNSLNQTKGFKIFELIFFISLLISNTIVSFMIVFYPYLLDNIYFKILLYFIDCIFLIEFIFNTFFIYNKNFKKNYSLYYYIICWFLYDWIVIFPYLLIGNYLIKIFIFSRLLRFIKFLKYNEYFKYLFSFIFNPGTDRILNIFCLTLITINSIGLTYYFIGELEFLNNNTWVIENELSNKSVFKKYITSFYWANFTLFSVGYGDYPANNYIEYIYSIIIFIFSIILNSIIISLISNYILDKFIYLKKLDKVNKILAKIDEINKNKKKSSSLKNYIKLKFQKNNEFDELIYSIPKDIRKELWNFIRLEKLKKYNYFNSKSKEFNNLIIPYLKEKNYFNNDVIYKKNETAKSIYFIYKGIVQIKINSSVLMTINEGDFFGDLDIFYYDSIRMFDAISIKETILFKFEFKYFEKFFLKKFVNYGKDYLYEIKKKKNKLDLSLKLNNIKLNFAKKNLLTEKMQDFDFLTNIKSYNLENEKSDYFIKEQLDHLEKLSKNFQEMSAPKINKHKSMKINKRNMTMLKKKSKILIELTNYEIILDYNF